VPDGHAEHEAEGQQGGEKRHDAPAPRARPLQRDEAERDVHHQQQHLHRQPGVHERVLVHDQRQQNRRDQ